MIFSTYFPIKNLAHLVLNKRFKNEKGYRFKYAKSLVLCFSVGTLSCSHFSEDKEYSSSKQFDKVSSSFQNSNGSQNSKSFLDFLSFLRQFVLRNEDPFENGGFPLRKPDLQFNSDQPSVTWIGHSTLLVRFNGKTNINRPNFFY